MSRSYHITERLRRRDHWFNRGDDGSHPEGLSKLDELSLKKLVAKFNEKWKRDTQKAHGLRRTRFVFKNGRNQTEIQKCRGQLSER